MSSVCSLSEATKWAAPPAPSNCVKGKLDSALCTDTSLDGALVHMFTYNLSVTLLRHLTVVK
jgi:hypothetical protein